MEGLWGERVLCLFEARGRENERIMGLSKMGLFLVIGCRLRNSYYESAVVLVSAR